LSSSGSGFSTIYITAITARFPFASACTKCPSSG
jgi:hypothetical protein